MGWIEDSGSVAAWQAVANGCYTEQSEESEGSYTHVPAVPFLDAATTLASLFDLIAGMSLAKSAMMDNIAKIRKHFPNVSAELKTPQSLQGAMQADTRTITEVAKDQASVAHQLLWLSRGIDFVVAIVKVLDEDREASMTSCVRKGYGQSLKPYHPLPVQTTVYMLAKAAPNRDTFIGKLSSSEDPLIAAKAVFEQLKVSHDANKEYLAAKGW